MTQNSFTAKLKNSVGLKVLSILIMVVLLMIPNSLVQELINERSSRKATVEAEVARSYGKEQVLYPAFIKIPYERTQLSTENKLYQSKGHLSISPNYAEFNIDVETDKRKRSIFEVIVYDATFTNNATINWEKFNLEEWKDYNFDFDHAYLVYGLTDANGIADSIRININGKPIQLRGSTNTGIGEIHWLRTDNFSLDMSKPLTVQSNWLLKGTSGLHIQPMGDLVEVQMKSRWPDPSFTGNQLPVHDVTEAGFSALWKVNKFSHQIPAIWQNDQNALDVSTDFGVNLIQPINEYGKNFRTSKYALLIISLTFGIFFFFEVLLKKSIHPIQYTLVGFALTVFYLLLLSITEHLGFNPAYGISSIATISLIVVYTHFILQRIGASTLLLALLSALFAYVFIILQMRDFALLAGAIALFVVLAVVMLLSRNVDWYTIGKTKESNLETSLPAS